MLSHLCCNIFVDWNSHVFVVNFDPPSSEWTLLTVAQTAISWTVRVFRCSFVDTAGPWRSDALCSFHPGRSREWRRVSTNHWAARRRCWNAISRAVQTYTMDVFLVKWRTSVYLYDIDNDNIFAGSGRLRLTIQLNMLLQRIANFAKCVVRMREPRNWLRAINIHANQVHGSERSHGACIQATGLTYCWRRHCRLIEKTGCHVHLPLWLLQKKISGCV